MCDLPIFYAAMFSGVVSASQATALLSELNDKIFWEPRCQRELLFTLRARWPDFTSRQRRAIERRIVKGPTRWEEEKASDFRRRRAVYAAERLAWLELNGCPLTPATAKKRSEEPTSELQSLMRTSYAVFCLKKKKDNKNIVSRY